MQSLFRMIAFVAASFLLVPQMALASDVEADLQDMKERMERMEEQITTQGDELSAAKATVAEQRVQLESAANQREETSALSDFISSTDISGFLATSYNFNFDGSETANVGIPGYANSNSFELDQAFITMEKAASEESRAGFNFAIQTGNATTYAGSSTAVAVYSASVSYLAPIGNGLQVDAGIMPTLLGAEVEQTNANWNITRGAVWGLQPVTNVGIVASTSLGNNLSAAFGFLNDPIAGSGRSTGGTGTDNDSNKGFTSQVSYAGESFGLNVAFNYGDDSGFGNNSVSLLDVVFTCDPSENLSAWVNFDYVSPDTAGDPSTVGIAVAARLAMSDSTGIAGRYEYVDYDGMWAGGDNTLNTITATVDHALTDNLTAKLEFRYDTSDVNQYGNPVGSEDSQTLGVAQLLYEF